MLGILHEDCLGRQARSFLTADGVLELFITWKAMQVIGNVPVSSLGVAPRSFYTSNLGDALEMFMDVEQEQRF